MKQTAAITKPNTALGLILAALVCGAWLPAVFGRGI